MSKAVSFWLILLDTNWHETLFLLYLISAAKVWVAFLAVFPARPNWVPSKRVNRNFLDKPPIITFHQTWLLWSSYYNLKTPIFVRLFAIFLSHDNSKDYANIKRFNFWKVSSKQGLFKKVAQSDRMKETKLNKSKIKKKGHIKNHTHLSCSELAVIWRHAHTQTHMKAK